jgi:hypothetical protein
MRMGVGNKNRSMSCVIALSLAWSASADISLTLRAQGGGVTAGRGQTRTAGVPGAPGGPGRGGQVGAPVATLSEFTVRSFDSNPSLGASYPRVIQLQHYLAGKGQLLATFSRRGPLPVYRSTDNGETWQFFSEVTGLRGQPALYELPQPMGEFPAGTIMAAGMADVTDQAKSVMALHYSRDGGRSWQFLSTIDEGGRGPYDPGQRAFMTRFTPIWEPYLYADAAGRLVAYISDERYKKDGYNQLLDHRVSSDGGRTWGALVFDVAIPDGLTRAGMAVVTRAGNGRFFMTYEMVGLPGYPLEPRSNPVHFRISTDGINFGDPRDRGILIQDRWRQFLWATPYIVWSPYPAPNGTLIASGRAVMRYELGQVGNGVMVNSRNGEGLWTLIETPIHYVPNPSGYSQTMIPLGDGREILQLVPVDGRIQYAKFKLPDKLPELEFPFAPKR